MRYKHYPEYKDSGVEWLGEVPAHWEVKRFKNLARLNPPKSEISNTLPDMEVQFLPMEMVSEDGKVSLKETRSLSEVYHGFTYFRDGDVIMAKITPCFENGKGAIVDNLENGIGFGSTEFHVLRPASGFSSYIWYITKSIPFRKIGIMEMKGVAGQQRVPESFVSEFLVATPPHGEQATIAAFLDEKTAQIDQLIEKKNRFIELLKEKRAALITEAVTGKFDVRTGKPYSEYKDSGVEWLGEVPVHWEVRRLKFVARYQNSNVDKKSHEGQKNVRLCNYTDVYYNEKITNNMDFMVATATDAEIKSMSLKEGNVVITKDSEDPSDIGIPALVSEPLDNVVCGYHLTVLRAKNQDAARYLHRAIQSHPTRAHFFVESPGVTRFGLNQDAIGGLVIPVPPIIERKKIAAFLDEKTTQIDQLIEKTQQSIDLLKEKRAALITAAVTGKIDVRDWNTEAT